jgi:hypothetical protein
MARFENIERALSSSSLLTAALGWRKVGVGVLLCWGVDDRGRCGCGIRNCSSPGKHPIGDLFPRGHKSATTDRSKIKRAVRRRPIANLAIVPSREMIVLDVDGDVGRATFESLDLPPTAMVMTSRGFHAYYRKVGDFPDKLPKLAGIDIKSDGTGYIVVPPSTHASGHEYAWDDATRALALIRHDEIRRSEAPSPATAKREPLIIAKGGRNSALTSLAGYLRYRGFADDQMLRVLNEMNAVACNPPLAETELATIARSIGKYPTDHEEAFGNLAEVVEKDLRWLAYPYFVRGAVNIIEGNPGDGKSTFVVALAAAVSARKSLPFVDALESGRVLILSAEDDPARVLKPRFRAHGADLSRIRFQQKLFTLDGNGLGLLRSEMASHRTRLVIIDPLIAYMDASVDLHRANDTMLFMNELDQLAREFDTTILIVRHLRKGDSNDALYRGLGSIAIAARVRSILLLGRHPHDPDVRALAHVKSNYAALGPTILFDLFAENTDRPPRIRWLGTTEDLRPEDLLAALPREKGRPSDEREQAKDLLRELLSKGEKPREEIIKKAQPYSFSDMTLRRAAADLGIRKFRKGGRSCWALP